MVTSLPSGKPAVLPVFDGPFWIFVRAPVRFLVKLGFWSMGIAFLVISALDMLGGL